MFARGLSELQIRGNQKPNTTTHISSTMMLDDKCDQNITEPDLNEYLDSTHCEEENVELQANDAVDDGFLFIDDLEAEEARRSVQIDRENENCDEQEHHQKWFLSGYLPWPTAVNDTGDQTNDEGPAILISGPKTITFSDESSELDADALCLLEQSFAAMLSENVAEEAKREELKRDLKIGQKLAMVREYERMKGEGLQRYKHDMDRLLEKFDHSADTVTIHDMEELTLCLSSRPVDVLRHFVEKDGVQSLNQLLSDSNYLGTELSNNLFLSLHTHLHKYSLAPSVKHTERTKYH